MAKPLKIKNIPESSNVGAANLGMDLPLLFLIEVECEAYAKHMLEMEMTIHDLVCKNQDMETNFVYKTHVLEDKAHELEDTMLSFKLSC